MAERVTVTLDAGDLETIWALLNVERQAAAGRLDRRDAEHLFAIQRQIDAALKVRQ